jgi:hypothetical protein
MNQMQTFPEKDRYNKFPFTPYWEIPASLNREHVSSQMLLRNFASISCERFLHNPFNMSNGNLILNCRLRGFINFFFSNINKYKEQF